MFDPEFDRVYASAIFEYSADRVRRVVASWPQAIIGGTGTLSKATVEQVIGREYEHYEYSDYPTFQPSIGFSQRGCRMAGPKSPCRKFCVVPDKEGFPRPSNTIAEIWRGASHPKKINLLDNDFFGNPQWRERVKELQDGGFKVCLQQGINIRLMTQEAAETLATLEYRNTKFNERKLYTAWDNLGDEAVFFKGVDTLERAGVPAKHLMAYMLIGCDILETWERIWYRFFKMVKRGIEPYPMVFNRSRLDLLAFQRWVITGLYRAVPFSAYESPRKSRQSVEAYERCHAGAYALESGHAEGGKGPVALTDGQEKV
jgi:hypothetical protein